MKNDDIRQLCFPVADTWAFDPDRLIRCDGFLIENSLATLKFKETGAERAEKESREAAEESTKNKREAEIFAKWAIERMDADDAADLTWGRCVQELGLVPEEGV